MRYLCSIALLCAVTLLKAQNKDTSTTISIKGYVDAYYAYFNNQLPANALQPYTTVAPRNARFGLNVAQLGVHYANKSVRSNVTLHYGDIAQATWSESFRQVQEANVGLKLFKNLWFDAGFFTTHIGTESFLPKNNWLSSTAVATYNEPFYQAGARLSWEINKKLYTELWLLNGYNLFLDKNSAKSIGILVNYAFTKQTSLTYTNLFGRESPDNALRQYRTYHNLYLQTLLSKKLRLQIGGDLGTQTNSTLADSSRTAIMYNALVSLRYALSPSFFISTRYEIFWDEHGFISGLLPTETGEQEGLQLNGYTVGVEYMPQQNAYLRAEFRLLDVQNQLVLFKQNDRYELLLTMGYYFSTSLK